jgi:hypothetical protein
MERLHHCEAKRHRYLRRLTPPHIPLNSGDTKLIELLPEGPDSFGSTTTVFQLERCQRCGLPEDPNLKIDEFANLDLYVID